MVRHIKYVHQQTKNFTCVICDQGFSQKTSLQGHMKKNHSNKAAGNTAYQNSQSFHGWKGEEISLSHQNGVALASIIAEVEDSLAKTVLQEIGSHGNQKRKEKSQKSLAENSNDPIKCSTETIETLESVLHKLNLNVPNLDLYKESIVNSQIYEKGYKTSTPEIIVK